MRLFDRPQEALTAKSVNRIISKKTENISCGTYWHETTCWDKEKQSISTTHAVRVCQKPSNEFKIISDE